MNQLPRRSCLPRRLLLGGAIASLTLGSVLSPPLTLAVRADWEDSPKTVVDEVWQIVNREFVDRDFNHQDWLQKRQELLGRSYTNRKQAYRAIREALKDLGDPYTRFLDPEDFSLLTRHTSGELAGVGLRLTVDPYTSHLVVVEALKNSPAIKAGIARGDRIVRIDGKPTALMALEQALEAINGDLGTSVSLQILREGKGVFEVTLTRAQIEIPSVSHILKEEGGVRVGYIKLEEFSSHAPEQMKQAIEELHRQQPAGFVLDLRGNPGGLLFASVDIARLWLEQGEIVNTIDRRGGDRHFSANGTSLTDLPLVILVNGGSASASEILASALKENGRAAVVGTTTYGKGTVQSVHSLSDGSGLAVTVARYYPPSGADIERKGIAPDVYLDLSMEQELRLKNDPSLMGTQADPQYQRAISLLKTRFASPPIPPTPQPVGIRWQDI